MKKIINGKKYDTDTATKLASGRNGYGKTDIYYCAEDLYQKKTGEFFLYGEGGPGSKYAVRVGSSGWSEGNDITPISEDEAKEWAEEYLDADEYEEIFGEVEE